MIGTLVRQRHRLTGGHGTGVNGVGTNAYDGGWVELWDDGSSGAAVPASASLAPVGTLVGAAPLPDSAITVAVGGVQTLVVDVAIPIFWPQTPTYLRVRDYTDENRIQSLIGGGIHDVSLDHSTLAVGQILTLLAGATIGTYVP